MMHNMFNTSVVTKSLGGLTDYAGYLMNSSQLVDSILSARYLREGEKTFEDICRRVAWAIGRAHV